jgi:hypothetical protein
MASASWTNLGSSTQYAFCKSASDLKSLYDSVSAAIYTHVSDEALRTTLERADVLGTLAA